MEYEHQRPEEKDQLIDRHCSERFHLGILPRSNLVKGAATLVLYFAASTEIYLHTSKFFSPQSFSEDFTSRFHTVVIGESAATLVTVGIILAAKYFRNKL